MVRVSASGAKISSPRRCQPRTRSCLFGGTFFFFFLPFSFFFSHLLHPRTLDSSRCHNASVEPRTRSTRSQTGKTASLLPTNTQTNRIKLEKGARFDWIKLKSETMLHQCVWLLFFSPPAISSWISALSSRVQMCEGLCLHDATVGSN